jgi:GntR family transcriptional regulator
MDRASAFGLHSEADRPLYRQLVDWLRADIGRMPVGAQIDSEPKLAARFGVSRFTVARAIEILVHEGLIRRRQGSGSFVAPPPLKRAPTSMRSFTESVERLGREASHRLLHFGPAEWREDLPYPEDAPLIALDRLRLIDAAPAGIHRSVIDAGLARLIGLTREVAAAPRFSLYQLCEEAGFIIERGTESLRARQATQAEAALLELGEELVVMTMRRLTWAANGALVDAAEAIYGSRRFTYEAEIRREHAPRDAARPPQTMENAHAPDFHHQRSFGPRIGPRHGRG